MTSVALLCPQNNTAGVASCLFGPYCQRVTCTILFQCDLITFFQFISPLFQNAAYTACNPTNRFPNELPYSCQKISKPSLISEVIPPPLSRLTRHCTNSIRNSCSKSGSGPEHPHKFAIKRALSIEPHNDTPPKFPEEIEDYVCTEYKSLRISGSITSFRNAPY